jgi:hypothetical protein
MTGKVVDRRAHPFVLFAKHGYSIAPSGRSFYSLDLGYLGFCVALAATPAVFLTRVLLYGANLWPCFLRVSVPPW